MTGNNDLVGRQGETTLFRKLMDETVQGCRRLLLVTGEAGSGKTRLAAEFSRIASDSGFNSFRCVWREKSSLPEYYALLQLLNAIGKKSSGYDNKNPAASESYDLSSATYDSSLKILHDLTNLIKESSRKDPCHIFFDDINFSGSPSLRLIGNIIDELSGCRVLMTFTYRTPGKSCNMDFLNFISDLKKDPDCTEVLLPGLMNFETGLLFENITGSPGDNFITSGIFRMTRGNPLFVREAALMFAGSNQIPRERYREIIDRDMPNAVNIIISRRLASLSPLCIEMLKKAAVIGELFTLDELKLLDYSFQESSLDLFADEAVSADFVRYSREEKAYLFSHSVVHQTILLNVREDDVRRDRIKLAGAAENPDAIMTKKTALKLASWWSEGRGPDARGKYLYYLLAAGDRAFTEGLMEEAAEIYERGLGHLALPEENEITDREAEILVKIGKARFRTGSRISALPYFKKAFHYYKKQNDIERMADIAYQPGYLAAGDPGFYNFYNDVLDMLDCDSPLKARVLSAYGINLLVNKGEYRKARQILDSAYKTAENCGDILCMQRTLIGLSYIDYSFHRYDAVLSTFAKASLLLEKQPDIFTEWHIHAASTALVRARNSGEPGDIIKWVPLLEGIAGCAKGHPFIRLRAQLLLFLSAYLLKEPAMAREAFTQFNLKKDYRYNVIRPYLLERFKGLAEHTLGNHEKAVKYLQKALDSALFFGDRPLSAWIRFELTEAAEGLEAEPGLSGSGLRHSLALCRDDAFSLGMIGLVGKIDDLSKKYGLNSGNNGNSLEMHLSARETEILKLLEKGFSNNKIAETLGISFFTVVNHVRNILKKTGAANRTQAASWARNEMFLNKYPDITRREIV